MNFMDSRDTKKEKNCFKIFEEVKKNPFILYEEIHKNIKLGRNTVTKYLDEMLNTNIIKGPYLHLKPSVNYPRFIQITTFSSPSKTFELFKGFPRISYHALCLGDWNFLFVTESPIDFSKLVGFSETHFCEKRGSVWDIPPQFCRWDDAFKSLQESLADIPRSKIPSKRQVEIPWSGDEWNLYHIFKDNLRRAATPAVKKAHLRYEDFTNWKKTLPQYTRIITAYYPQGFLSQILAFFLVETKKIAYIPSLFSYWPATTVFYRAGDKLLILVAFGSKDYIPKTLNLLEKLVSLGYISSYKYALLLQDWRH